MKQHWSVRNDCLEIAEMPFYWRLSDSTDVEPGISPRLPIRVVADPVFDYLKFDPNDDEWTVIDRAYQQNENIGFINPESGQLHTYGTSVNNFFLNSITQFDPASIYEIGCGAGFTIEFLKSHGRRVTGIDPSGYSLKWSQKLGFPLINAYFRDGMFTDPADFIYCNDVFEHIPDVVRFSELVYHSLAQGGVFSFATTNSSQSIEIGDISMLEHQHVNMFTERSIYRILKHAGFGEISINGGSYGNTFQVNARKVSFTHGDCSNRHAHVSCEGFFERAMDRLTAFAKFFEEVENCHFYVPLRSIPYLAAMGDYGLSSIYDSNTAWRGKYIDGYTQPIRSPDDILFTPNSTFFVGSMTFYEEIKSLLVGKGFSEGVIRSIRDL